MRAGSGRAMTLVRPDPANGEQATCTLTRLTRLKTFYRVGFSTIGLTSRLKLAVIFTSGVAARRTPGPFAATKAGLYLRSRPVHLPKAAHNPAPEDRKVLFGLLTHFAPSRYVAEFGRTRFSADMYIARASSLRRFASPNQKLGREGSRKETYRRAQPIDHS